MSKCQCCTDFWQRCFELCFCLSYVSIETPLSVQGFLNGCWISLRSPAEFTLIKSVTLWHWLEQVAGFQITFDLVLVICVSDMPSPHAFFLDTVVSLCILLLFEVLSQDLQIISYASWFFEALFSGKHLEICIGFQY